MPAPRSTLWILHKAPVLIPAYVFGLCVGFLPVRIAASDKKTTRGGPFIFSPSLFTLIVLFEMIVFALWVDTFIGLKQMGSLSFWMSGSLFFIETYYIFFFSILNARKNTFPILNRCFKLLQYTESSSFSFSTALPFSVLAVYILKLILRWENFIQWPSINITMYVRYFQVLALENLVAATMTSVEVLIKDINCRLRKTLASNNLEFELKEIISLRWKVERLAESLSTTLGAAYFPLLLMNEALHVLGLTLTVQPVMLSQQRIDKDIVLNIFEWNAMFYSICVICRLSHKVFNESQKTKRTLHEILIKRKPNRTSSELVHQFIKLVNGTKLYFKAGKLLLYDYKLLFTILNMAVTIIIGFLPASASRHTP